jgi:hypothetical protein
MAELKTTPNDGDVDAFLDGIEDESKQADSRELVELMTQVTGAPPKLWGPSIVGFGSYHYKYASGHEGDWFLVGFAPRKRELTLYVMAELDRHADLLAKLGKHRHGKSCLHVKGLDAIHRPTLRKLVKQTVAQIRKAYPE